MKSFLAKKQDIQRKWLLVDADGQVLGRLASKVAMILMGKNKPIYTPNVDTGDAVVIINAEKIRVTGNKKDSKEYQYYTGYPSGQRIIDFKDLFSRKPEKVVELAIKRMMPKNTLAKAMLKKLKIYRGGEHEQVAQQPQKIEL
jgi:large subunit ribosomal protein L13